MNNPTVAVLMSTYNGEKYLKEQIDSILSQQDVDITLYIRDDGSSDHTVEMIQQYESNGNVHLLLDGDNLRPGMSFMRLFYHVMKYENKHDYYAFADQDDIWLERKMILAIRSIQEKQQPALYGSNQIIYRDGKDEGLRYHSVPDLTLMGHIATNTISGCTMVMNLELAEVLSKLKCPSRHFLTVRCHDSWIYLVACVSGCVIYDERALILYRQHSNNVVGVKKIDIKYRFRRFINHKVKNMRMLSATYLLQAFPEKKYPEKEHLENIAHYQESISSRFKLIKDYRYCKIPKENFVTYFLKICINYL